MKEIPSAEEYIKTFSGGKFNIKKNGDVVYTQSGDITFQECALFMKAFASIHVEAALKAASENATLCWKNDSHPKGWPYFAWNPTGTEEHGDKATHVDRDSILNAYPETNIK